MVSTAEVVIESAKQKDLAQILALLSEVGLPHDGIEQGFDAGVVARDDTKIVGSALLEVYGDAALLRSVAVAPSAQGTGLGLRLTQAVLDLAQTQKIEQVYLLTETAEGFFPRFGFQPIQRADVASPVQQSVEFTSACPASAAVMVVTF